MVHVGTAASRACPVLPKPRAKPPRALAKRSVAEAKLATGHRPLLSAFPVQPLCTINFSTLRKSCLHALLQTEPKPFMRLSATSLTGPFIRADPRKSVATIFLNCTKNTELTASPLPRTFCFALKQKLNTTSVDDTNQPGTNTWSTLGNRQLSISKNHQRHNQKLRTEN